MKAKSPIPSRYAAMLMGLVGLMHALVALDLLLQFFPPTPEIQALWTVSAFVKGLWVAFVVLALATSILLYRAPVPGFLLSLGAILCLYFASMGLWQELKGGFWLAVVASVLAAVGAWRAKRSNNSFKPKPLRSTKGMAD